MNNGYRLRELKIEVNRSCPLYCLHCSSNGMPNAAEKLAQSRLVDLIKEFHELGGKKLAITGGEPLFYEGLPLILGICRSYNIEAELYTTGICLNGQYRAAIDEKLVSFLVENRIKVIFSLHGAFAKTHDILTRVEGSFNITMNAIERVLTAGISAEVHIVPTAINFDEIADLARLIASFNIRRLSWLRFVPQGRGEKNRSVLQLNSEQLKKMAQKKLELSEQFPNLEIRTGAPFNILCPQSPALCMAGLHELVIRSDGCAVPCDAFKRFSVRDNFNNIEEYSLSEIWANSYLLNSVRRIQESKHDSICASCPSFSSCQSGCLAQKAIATRTLEDSPDPDCLLKRGGARSCGVEAVSV